MDRLVRPWLNVPLWLVCCLGLVGFGAPLFGHQLVGDGSVGASMHISPDDDPIAGQPSGFQFWIKDTSGKLSIENCKGFFSVISAGKQIAIQPLFAGNTTGELVSAHQFTFPQKGVYTVRIWGTPNGSSPVAFQPFVIDYTVRVARDAAENSAPAAGFAGWIGDHLFHILLGAGLLIVVIVWSILASRRSKRTRK